MDKEIKMIDIWVQQDANGNITSWADSELDGYTKYQVAEEDFRNFNDTEGKAFDIIDGVAVKVRDTEQEKEKLSRRVDNIRKLAVLKEELSSSDYKVIKCAEAQIIGADMPYNAEELHNERQAIRDEINRLGADLSE